MDRLDAMETLLAVVEAGSLSAASRRLGTPLPTVSRRISELETHLKTRLLVRSTRRLALTDAGEAYVAAARRIVEEIREAEQTAAGEYSTPRGELVVTAPVVFGRLHVLPIVCDFLALYPEIDLRLFLSDRNAHLVDDHIDIAVRIGALPDSALVAAKVGEVRTVICGSPGFFAGYGAPKEPGDLSALPCVTFSALGTTMAWEFPGRGTKGKHKEKLTVPLRSRLCVNTAEAAIDAAIAGVGVTRVLSYQISEALSQKKLRLVLQDFEAPSLPVSLVHAGGGLLPLKMRAFLDFAAPRLRERLQHSGL